jgi:hypothetical protein
LAEKKEFSKKLCSTVNLSNINTPPSPDLDKIPGQRRGKPATNRLIYVMDAKMETTPGSAEKRNSHCLKFLEIM